MSVSSGASAADLDVYDYVIVGAGSAGCVLADRLSQDRDVTVCVLEAGGSDDSPIVRTPMLLQLAIKSENLNWGYVTQPQKNLNNRELVWPRGKTLGGSSSINAMHYIRGARENYDEWATAYGAEGWAWDDVFDCFTRVQAQGRGASTWHGADGPLHVEDIAPINPLTELFLQSGDELQYPRNADFNGDAQLGFGVYQTTQRNGRRWSAADAFLRPAMERHNVSVITKALVHRVVLEGGRAVGVAVEVDGDMRDIRARKEVVLSGGAINSPQLLMLSGIGPADELRDVGVSVEVDIAGVGKNMQDHLDITAMADTKSARSIGYSWRSAPKIMGDVLRWMMRGDGDFMVNPVQGGGFVRSSRAGDLPDIQLVFIPALTAAPGEDIVTGHGVTCHACCLYPKSRGEIRLKSADPTAHPVIEPNYLGDDEDMEVMIDGLEIARRVLAAPAFDEERVSERFPGAEKTSRSDLADDVRARAETLFHPTSTCAMGTGELAVVDPRCRVRGVEGLRVVDASVMPRLVGGNTNAPTLMIAERASEFIRADA